MIWTLVLIASLSRTPAIAVPNIWFYSQDTCQNAGAAWVSAANAAQRGFGAGFICFAAPSTRAAEPPANQQ